MKRESNELIWLWILTIAGAVIMLVAFFVSIGLPDYEVEGRIAAGAWTNIGGIIALVSLVGALVLSGVRALLAPADAKTDSPEPDHTTVDGA